MYFVVKLAVGVLMLLGFAYPCNATSDHEMNVGSQKEQICDASVVEIVGKFLKIDTPIIPTKDIFPAEGTVIASAACKTIPTQKQITITAIAYDSGKEDVKTLVIALVDTRKGDVISSYQSEIEEDASMRIVSGSLWIDTAPYYLTSEIRAFGLDVTSGYISHCAEGGVGATRTLFVQEGRQVRPVLHDLMMSYWSFIQQGKATCVPEDDESKPSIIKNTSLSIGLADTSTNGYRDLVVTALTSRNDGKKIKQGPFRCKIHYDGQKYFIQEMKENLNKWNN